MYPSRRRWWGLHETAAPLTQLVDKTLFHLQSNMNFHMSLIPCFCSSCSFPTCLETWGRPSLPWWSAPTPPQPSLSLASRYHSSCAAVTHCNELLIEDVCLLIGDIWSGCHLHHHSNGLGWLCLPRLPQLLHQLASGALSYPWGHGLHVCQMHTLSLMQSWYLLASSCHSYALVPALDRRDVHAALKSLCKAMGVKRAP